ncbi:hypothetical protein D1AOALGA4SA_3398 [Olavius algarvensis Delta 1 endosymbiont]|nr:hypothetical protein D1AOALGA4SA_3398 [Olavius algarvensis Delta 1 endosymbiont]
MTNGGIASLSRFKIDRIHYSTFDVGRSMFNVYLVAENLVLWARSELIGYAVNLLQAGAE